MNKHSLIYATLLTVLSACSGGTVGSADKPVLLASIEPEAVIIKEIAGPSYNVVTLLDRSNDPETFEPGTAKLRESSRASVYFATGLLPFEGKIIEMLPDSIDVFVVSKNIPLITGSHGDEHTHDADPHIFNSFVNLQTVATNICQHLSKLNPDSTSAYKHRCQALNASLDEQSSALDSLLRGRAFGVWHPSLSYLARDYGMQQIAVGIENKESGTRQMRQAIDLLRQNNVNVVFYEDNGQRPRVEAIASGAGARAIELRLLGPDFINQLNQAANEIVRP